jgi:tRNA 2-(methylsulfanyl)-N6-isopentenyladenosine37 hydroxylase
MFCLRAPTDSAWAREAIKSLDTLLVDHAHCEMKAATNALSLVVRYPHDLSLVRALTDLAREELDHFGRVVAFLERSKLPLGPPPVDHYAAELRNAMRRLPAGEVPGVTDRLLVGALIEARSCERFKLLLGAFPADAPKNLRVFYEELVACEARHYRVYVDLAVQSARPQGQASEDEREQQIRDAEIVVQRRLRALAEAEAAIVTRLASRDSRATVHG